MLEKDIVEMITRSQQDKIKVRLAAVDKRAIKQDQTGIIAPGNYDQVLGLFVGTKADGSQVRYRPGKNSVAPATISLTQEKGSQVGFGDWL